MVAAFRTLIGVDKEAFQEVPDFMRVYIGCLADSLRHVQVVDAQLMFEVGNSSLRILSNTKSQSPLVLEGTKLLGDVLDALQMYNPALVATLHGFLRKDVSKDLTKALKAWTESQKGGACPAPLGEEEGGLFGGHLINRGLAGTCTR